MNLFTRFSVVWRAGLRPARWSFAAAVGVVAACSVSLVAARTPPAAHASPLVASQPFAAQPTVTEGAIDADGVRLLAGADRYATSVLLASVPLDAGDAATRVVLVVSGESLVDAVSAVSVAASRDAAIVLTETGRVPTVVRDFVADRGFDTVTVGGGTAAVSAATADALAVLTSGEAADAASGARGVERVAGATRYETAVAAARAAGRPGDWCDTAYRGAMVVSGESLVDGVIAAPLAYAWRLPLLFTEPDALPEVVDEFLKGVANVRHVTIVGAPADINPTVVRDIARSNDIEVLRIDATTPAERSVELAEAVAHCRTQPVAPGQYALLDANQPVDGVAAAAALANGLGAHGTSETLIPVLAVNQNSLPQPVADYLAKVGRRHDTITLYPLGGVARLTPRVINSAVVAAGGEPPEPAATADADADAGDSAIDDAGDGAPDPAGRPPATRRPAGSRNPDDRYPGDVGAPPAGGAPGEAGSRTAVDGVSGAAGGAAGVPDFAATEDLDGDGELSFDELYPADTPHRNAYLAVSDGVAPPGAFAPPVPDVLEVRDDPRRSELSLGRSSHDRFPNGFPLPPGAPDYATTTFEERQQLRANAYAAYAKPDPSWGAPLNTARGQWNELYRQNCITMQHNRNGTSGRVASVGFETYPCEWLVDWSIWQCDVLNEPAVTRLAAHEQWTELIVRYYDLVVDLMGRDRFSFGEISDPMTSYLSRVQFDVRGFWEGVTYTNGVNYCAFRIDDQPTAANETFHNQQVTEMHDHFNTDFAIRANWRVRCDVWLPRNAWYVARDPVTTSRC